MPRGAHHQIDTSAPPSPGRVSCWFHVCVVREVGVWPDSSDSAILRIHTSLTSILPHATQSSRSAILILFSESLPASVSASCIEDVLDALRHRFDQFDALVHRDAFPLVLQRFPQAVDPGRSGAALPQASLCLIPQVLDWIEVWGLSQP